MKKEKVSDISRPEVFLKNSEILFVDDEKELLFTVDEYLSQRGYNITVVDSGFYAPVPGQNNHFRFRLVFLHSFQKLKAINFRHL